MIVYKSAKYSVEAPLTIGAALGGASLAQLAALHSFGLPLGVAYQLRDDLLGVFGDPEVTGKPAGDDLREGKRTVLIALARTRLPASSRNLMDELLGDPGLDSQQVDMIRTALRDCGAIEEVEKINGKPFKIAGFEWDYGGYVSNWTGGSLGSAFLAPGQLAVRLAPPELAEGVQRADGAGDVGLVRSESGVLQGRVLMAEPAKMGRPRQGRNGLQA